MQQQDKLYPVYFNGSNLFTKREHNFPLDLASAESTQIALTAPEIA
jgi:hypothetical protein